MADIIYNPDIWAVNVNGFNSAVDVSLSGTVGGIDIMFHGYGLDVAVTGSVAHITLTPRTSGNKSRDGANLTEIQNVNSPFELSYALRPTDTLEPVKLYDGSLAYENKPFIPNFHYVFTIAQESLAGFAIRRIRVSNGVTDYQLIDKRDADNFVVIDENTAYSAVKESPTYSLLKFDFCNNSYKETELFDLPLSQDGYTFNLASTIHVIHCQYEELDFLVLVHELIDSTSDIQAMRIDFFDLDAEVVTDTVYAYYESSPVAGTAWNTGYTGACINGADVIFTACISNLDSGTHSACAWPTFICSIVNKTVNRIENVVDALDSADDYNDYSMLSGIDRDNNDYYFFTNALDLYTPPHLFKVDLSLASGTMSDTTLTIDYPTYSYYPSQGNYNFYIAKRDTSPVLDDTYTLLTVPGLTQVGEGFTLPVGVSESLPRTPLIDEASGYAWFLRKTDLLGVPLLAGGTNITKAVNWIGGTIPWEFPTTKFMSIAVVSDLLFVRVYSYSTAGLGQYQNDLYVLMPTFDCT